MHVCFVNISYCCMLYVNKTDSVLDFLILIVSYFVVHIVQHLSLSTEDYSTLLLLQSHSILTNVFQSEVGLM